MKVEVPDPSPNMEVLVVPLYISKALLDDEVTTDELSRDALIGILADEAKRHIRGALDQRRIRDGSQA